MSLSNLVSSLLSSFAPASGVTGVEHDSLKDKLFAYGIEAGPDLIEALVKHGPGTVAAVLHAKDGMAVQTLVQKATEAWRTENGGYATTTQAPPPPPPPSGIPTWLKVVGAGGLAYLIFGRGRR